MEPNQTNKTEENVCTVGLVSRSVERLEKLMATGMNVTCMKFSHGSHEYHAETISNVRQPGKNYSAKMGYTNPIAVAWDPKGIRTGLIEGSGSGEVELKKNETIKLSTNKYYPNIVNVQC